MKPPMAPPLLARSRARFVAGAFALAAMACAAAAPAAPLPVLAAENFYGDLVEQIGGRDVAVFSILQSPSQDPHAFEASASTARRVAEARLVVYNGAGYDPWMTKLLSASPSPSRETLEVARLLHRKAGDNPHLWYDAAGMTVLADALAASLSKLDPAHRAAYAERRAAFGKSMRRLLDRIAALRGRYAGSPVAETEPVFGYMAQALGLRIRDPRFALAVMNETEPSAKSIAAFERDLRTHSVHALIYNRQTGSGLARRMRSVAIAAGVPVVEVTETEPPGERYAQWMLRQLDALERALAGGAR